MNVNITETDRVKTMAQVERAVDVFELELKLVDLLDRHRVTHVGNLGYYRSDVHCSCAAEWWTGEHEGDPSFSDMWDIHRAEVIRGFLDDREALPSRSTPTRKEN